MSKLAKYPIICSPMNGVSDVKLAIACSLAGIIPSLVVVENYMTSGVFDLSKLEQDLGQYAAATSNGTMLIACDAETLIDHASIVDLLARYHVSMVEILNFRSQNAKEVRALHLLLKEQGIIMAPKLLGGFDAVNRICNNVGMLDCVSVKGPMGAGRGIESISLDQEIVKIKQSYPNMTVIASGGINTSQDVKRMLELGADFVSMGTVFCASQESSMSLAAKKKIIQSTSLDTQRLSSEANQRALVFSAVEENDSNNTSGLLEGVRTGVRGHIYMGTGIDHVTAIEPVQTIVDRLVRDL